MAMDIVYVVGNRSAWDDNELKYSLRSVHAHVQDVENVYIIGYKPPFVNDEAIFIPYDDKHTNSARNIAEKLHYVCRHSDVSDEFLFMADDMYFLEPTTIKKYAYHYNGSLEDVLKNYSGVFVHHVMATKILLKKLGVATLNFDCHYPIRINRYVYPLMYGALDLDVPFGYTIKSLYCNYNYTRIPFCETARSGDAKLRFRGDGKSIESFVVGRKFFSTGDLLRGDDSLAVFESLFPEKSRWER